MEIVNFMWPLQAETDDPHKVDACYLDIFSLCIQ